MSPRSGVNIMPRIARPKRNIKVTAAKMRAPRPVRFCRKCPPPGISHAATMGPIQTLTGAAECLGGAAAWVCAIRYLILSLAPLQLLAQHVEEGFVAGAD